MDELGQVLWIGGPPGSGKTTVARLLAREYGLRWYSCDARTWLHRDRAIAAGVPAAIRWESMTPAERASAPVEDLFAMSLHSERGPMTLDDLRALPTAPMVVAEGTTISPRIVPEGAADRAVWLFPSYDVRRERLERRGLSGSGLELYLMKARRLREEIDAAGARTLVLDGHGVAETVAEVAALFADALATGPTARTAEERRALLRYANRAVVDQHLAFFARPWSTGDAATTVRTFDCECAAPDCRETVELTIGGFPAPPDEGAPDEGAPPVLAPGHRAA